MGEIQVTAEGPVNAPPDVVYNCLRDYKSHHPHFLPPAFTNFALEEGGIGAGTKFRVDITAAGRSRQYHMRVDEPEPGRVMTESDTNSSMVTRFTVIPVDSRSRVRMDTTWEGAGGIGGFFERLFAPRFLRKVMQEEIALLDKHAAAQAEATG
jgi:hypothetical protein